MDRLYAILWDGPCAGLVVEVEQATRDLQVTTDGTHMYRRCRMHPAQPARIAQFTYTGSLVI